MISLRDLRGERDGDGRELTMRQRHELWVDLTDGTGHPCERTEDGGWRCRACGAESMDKQLFAEHGCPR